MTTRVHFTKMHGAGNDYIYVDTSLYNIPDPAAAARRWSAPHTGIGSDGLVLISEAGIPEADYAMRIFNADGSEAMMCGNASRCIGKYLYEKGITTKTAIRLLTLSGIKTLRLTVDGGNVESVEVDMLKPALHNKAQFLGSNDGKEAVLGAGDTEFCGTFVSMGNPHFVIFTDDIAGIDVSRYGQLLEYNPAFPERCNIEFAQILPDGRIRTRVWERGSGITMACGTGACATAVAAAVTQRAPRQSEIIMDGGTLSIRWCETDNHVYMRGPAAFVFEGDTDL
ncbi:MAG: diaminopimelate epimerase [Prevotella sp.]|nr:diaminopimelate epimerase [Prevotella sp.]